MATRKFYEMMGGFGGETDYKKLYYRECNETSQLRSELEAAKQEIAGLRSSLSASERFRIEDGMSSVNEQNELRKEIERLKGLLYIAWAENYDPHNAKYLPVTRDRNWEKFKSEHNL